MLFPLALMGANGEFFANNRDDIKDKAIARVLPIMMSFLPLRQNQ